MISSRYRTVVAAAFALTMSGCGSDIAPTNAGLEGAPRIVSLNPCLDAILVEVADPQQILALSHYSSEPQSSSILQEVASQFAVTGGTVEEVLALKPDIVLASTFVAPSTRAAFDELGLRLETFGSPTTIKESLLQVREVARLTGNANAGETLAREIERAVSSQDSQRELSSVLWQPGGIVPGEQQLISELLRAAGFASHSAALGLKQADYMSLEQVLASPPEVLLVAGESRAQQHPALEKTDVTIAAFDPSLLYCGGQTIPRAMERLREIRESLA